MARGRRGRVRAGLRGARGRVAGREDAGAPGPRGRAAHAGARGAVARRGALPRVCARPRGRAGAARRLARGQQALLRRAARRGRADRGGRRRALPPARAGVGGPVPRGAARGCQSARRVRAVVRRRGLLPRGPRRGPVRAGRGHGRDLHNCSAGAAGDEPHPRSVGLGAARRPDEPLRAPPDALGPGQGVSLRRRVPGDDRTAPLRQTRLRGSRMGGAGGARLVPRWEVRRRRRAGARLRPGDAGLGAAADSGGGPVFITESEAAPGRVNKAHAARGARGPAELVCFRCPKPLVLPRIRSDDRPRSLRPSLLRVPDERDTPGRRRRDPSRNAGWRRYRRWTPSRRPRGPPSSPAKPRRSRAPRRSPPGPRARRRRGTGQSVQVPATTSAPSSARAPARKL